jgi:hypothetical protein
VGCTAGSAVIEVVATRGGPRGISVHRVRSIHPDDRAQVDGIPVTSAARTLLDLAEILPARQFERAWDQAEGRELLDLTALEALLARSHGHHGLEPLIALLAEHRRPEPTKSELEVMFLELCREAGIPLPAMNVMVAGEEVDAYWPQHGLVVELDGWEHHKTRADRERDILKEERIKLAGHPFLRFSYRRVQRDPIGVANAIRRTLAS